MGRDLIVVLLSVLIVGTHCSDDISLPDDVQLCHLSDPNFSDCVVKLTPYLIPQLIKGNAKYHVPNFNPLFIPQIVIQNANLELTLKNVRFYGFDKLKVLEFHLDKKKQEAKLVITIPELFYTHEYNLRGQILLLPMQGSGPANVTLYDGVYESTFNYKLNEKNGKRYAKVDKTSGTFIVKLAKLHLEGLFQKNRQLGEETNKILNENWKEVLNDLGPAVFEAFREVFKEIFNRVLEKVSIDTLFPE